MYRFIKPFMALLLWAYGKFNLHPHSGQITGQIIASEDKRFNDASIPVKGTAFGVVSDTDGDLALTVPNYQILIKRNYIGFSNRWISVGENTSIETALLVTGA